MFETYIATREAGNPLEPISESMERPYFTVRSERGVSLLELAIVIPVIVLIVAGIVDYGFALREIQLISSASREGARIAAAHSRINHMAGGVRLPCKSGKSPASGVRCDAADLTVQPTDPVANAAQKGACSFMKNSGLNLGDWSVESDVPDSVEFEGAKFDVVTVKIKKKTEATKCILCWGSLLEAFRPQAESSFNLETNCNT